MALFLTISPRLSYISEALLGGIISAAASATAAGVSAGSAVYKTKKQFEYAKKMAAYQNELNQSAWKMQQEYNTPAAQMQRYMDAGLSPNLLYGSVSPGNATSAPQMVAPQEQAPDFQQAITTALSSANIEAQNRLLTAQAKSVELQNKDTEALMEGKARNDIEDWRDKRLDGTLEGYYNFLTKLQLRGTEEGFNYNRAKSLLTATQNSIQTIELAIKSATQEDQKDLVHNLNALREVELAIKNIMRENQEELQSFNQKSPELMFWVRIASMIAGSASQIIQ